MKKTIALLAVMLILVCGCMKIEDIDIPERTPEATTTPSPSAEPVITPEPTPEATPEVVEVPENLDELSEKIGMKVFVPATTPKGYKITEVGYDGSATAALKYTSDEKILLYTYCASQLDPPESGRMISDYGLEAYYRDTDMSSMIQWIRGGNTYQIIAEPALDEIDMTSLMGAMLSGPMLEAEEITVSCKDLHELSDMVGYTAWEPSYLPDNTTLSDIQCYKLYTTVIKYLSESDILTFKTCEGRITPSFDTETYVEPFEAAVGSQTVTYYANSKGNIILAQWYSKGYTHQIFSESGVKPDTMEMLVVGFSK